MLPPSPRLRRAGRANRAGLAGYFFLSLTTQALTNFDHPENTQFQSKTINPSFKNHSTYKMLVVLSISQKDYEHNTIPHRRNPHLFQNKETSAKKTCYPCNLRQIFNQKRSYLPAKIQKSKFFLSLSTQTLTNSDNPKIHEFSTKCAGSP